MNEELLLSIFALIVSTISFIIIGILSYTNYHDRIDNLKRKDEEQEYLFEMMMINKLNSIYTELDLYFSKENRDYEVLNQNKVNQLSVYQLKKIYVAYYTTRMYDELIEKVEKDRENWFKYIEGDLLEEYVLRYLVIMLNMLDYCDKNKQDFDYITLKRIRNELGYERYNIDEFINTTREKPMKKIIYDYRFRSIKNIQVRVQ